MPDFMISHSIHAMQLGEHVCQFYASAEERASILTQYILCGVEERHKIFLLTDDPQSFCMGLPGDILSCKALIERGAMEVLTIRQAAEIAANGESGLNPLLTQARAHGFRAVRVAIDGRGLAAGREGGFERWMNAELSFTRLIQDREIMILCQFEKDSLNAETSLAVLKAHPSVIVNLDVMPNPYLESDGDQVETNGPAETLERCLTWLSHRRQAESGLQHSEEHFRSLFEDAPLAYQSLDADGNLLAVNRAWCDMLGYSKQEVLGRWYGSFLVAPQQELFRMRFSNFKEIGQIRNIEFEMVCKKEETVFVSASGNITRTVNGEFRRTHCILQNITEQKRAERKLWESDQRYRALFENNNEPILIIDPQSGDVKNANQAALRFYGYTQNEITRLKIWQINTLPNTEVRRLMGDSLVLNRNTFEFRHRLASGEVRDVEVYSGPIQINGDSLLYSIVHDITEKKRAEKRAERIQRLYEVVSKVSQVAAYSHSLPEIFKAACRILVDSGGFKMVWIGRHLLEKQMVVPAAWAGDEQGYLENIVIRTTPDPEGVGPIGTSVRETCLVISNNIASDPLMEVWRKAALARGFHSMASFPLQAHGHTHGAMAVYSSEVDFFDDREVELLNQVSSALNLAMESIEEEERRLLAEKALQESEERYRHLFSSGNDAIFVYPLLPDGSLGNFIEVNRVSCLRTGYSVEELLKMRVTDINPAEDEVSIHRRLSQIREKKNLLFETSQLTRDGRRVPVEVNTSLFEMDGMEYVLSISRDISERREAESKIQMQIDRLSSLRSIDKAISSKLSLPTVLDVVLEQVVEQLNVSAAAILLVDPSGNELVHGASKGFKGEEIKNIRLPFNRGISGMIAAHRITIKVNDVLNDARFSRKELFQHEGFSCFHGTPLISKGVMLGVLEVYHQPGLDDNQEWRDFMETLAGQAAIAIEDSNMFDNLTRSNQVLSQAYDETIEGWARALDLRDHETEGHSRRVTYASQLMAQRIGLSEEEQTHIRRGALLHDIGKVGVPDPILMKPGSLSPNEWAIMKQHPQYAYDLLSPISFLRPALDIPYSHHERWDGSGYPQGLAGTAIPLAARIFAVVDVWDALRSDRPYRPRWSKADTVEYIRNQAGLHFDPAAVAVFLSLVDQLDQDE